MKFLIQQHSDAHDGFVIFYLFFTFFNVCPLLKRFLRLEKVSQFLTDTQILQPAATYNLTPYSMLCKSQLLRQAWIAWVNTVLIAHNQRDGTYLSSVNVHESARSLRWEYCYMRAELLLSVHRYGAVVHEDNLVWDHPLCILKLVSALTVSSRG